MSEDHINLKIVEIAPDTYDIHVGMFLRYWGNYGFSWRVTTTPDKSMIKAIIQEAKRMYVNRVKYTEEDEYGNLIEEYPSCQVLDDLKIYRL